MRIDLPQCNFKTCLYSFDGNCVNKNRYETCEYQLDKIHLLALVNKTRKQAILDFVEHLKENSCFYDLDNYHSFRAVDMETIDDIVKEVLGDYDD